MRWKEQDSTRMIVYYQNKCWNSLSGNLLWWQIDYGLVRFRHKSHLVRLRRSSYFAWNTFFLFSMAGKFSRNFTKNTWLCNKQQRLEMSRRTIKNTFIYISCRHKQGVLPTETFFFIIIYVLFTCDMEMWSPTPDWAVSGQVALWVT